ncbi:hypothetical protein [Caproicibacterium amylolyticum]|uniref:hypothetical protein n=1 Tax=Caproicibacterium amylolyticum TaxID=2766537 RepID=UPI003CCCD270
MERSHRNDQRYFYDWEKFSSVYELNQKLETHLSWSNNKAMRTLAWKSPLDRLAFFLGSHHLQTQKIRFFIYTMSLTVISSSKSFLLSP